MRRMPCLGSLLTVLLPVLAATGQMAGASTLRIAAMSGDPAPGAPSGAVFLGATTAGNGGFDFSVLNGAGEVAFFANLIGPGLSGSNSRGIWSEGGGAGLRQVARGQHVGAGPTTAPGVESNVYFHDFRDPLFDDVGRSAFHGTLFGPGVDAAGGANAFGIWSEGGGSGLALLARTGDPAPGTASGVVFTSVSIAPLLNDAGQVAFTGGVAGPGVTVDNDLGIWSEGGGAGLAVVVREGDAAPGTGSGVSFSGFGQPVLNSAGQTTFRAFLRGAGVSGFNDSGLWSERGGVLDLVVREGDPAPDTGPGASFADFSRDPVTNDAGQTAFLGRLAGSASSSDTGIWSDGGGAGLSLVAREGDAAPGTSGGAVFAHMSYVPVLNGAGHTAFRALLTGPGVDATNRDGIWSEGRGAGLALVARSGDPAPGAETGAVFLAFGPPLLNGVGQTAFRAWAAVPGGASRVGIWVEDRSGGLSLVARIGELIDVDAGPGSDLRPLSAISLVPPTGHEDGRMGGFNDRGQLAFTGAFADRSEGVFVFEPDPSLWFTSPRDGEVVGADEVLVEGVATDDGRVVSVVVNGVPAALVSTGNPHDPAEVIFSALVPLAPGPNAIVATASDDAGNDEDLVLTVESDPQTGPLVCDANADGGVDRIDIGMIFAARGSAAAGDDPRDINRDGLITVNDGRLCVFECTNPGCGPVGP